MSLILSRSYPDDPIEENRERFWRVTCEGVYVGAIVHHTWQSARVWGWSITVQDPNPDIDKNGSAPSRDDAARQFRIAWDKYRAWLGDDRWLQWIKHVELVDARAKAKRY